MNDTTIRKLPSTELLSPGPLGVELAGSETGNSLALFASAAACRACPAMGCRPVLSARNGPAQAQVMFIGEAPGRFGAGRTGVPFSGDAAGRRFELLLAEAGLERQDVFVTNAVLCLPLDARGRNRPPRASEIRACSSWLSRTIDVANPQLVVAMGGVALKALVFVEGHPLTLAAAGSSPIPWHSRRLAALYHPGARAQIHRPWEAQREDWRRLGEVVRATVASGRMLRS